jgi:hypothetical protein
MYASVCFLCRARSSMGTLMRRAGYGVVCLVVLALQASLASVPLHAAESAQPEATKPDRQIRNMDALSVVLLRATAPKDARSASTLGV